MADMEIYFPGGKRVYADYNGFTVQTDQPASLDDEASFDRHAEAGPVGLQVDGLEPVACGNLTCGGGQDEVGRPIVALLTPDPAMPQHELAIPGFRQDVVHDAAWCEIGVDVGLARVGRLIPWSGRLERGSSGSRQGTRWGKRRRLLRSGRRSWHARRLR